MSFVILVTGGANRIGLAITEYLLKEGCRVIVQYHSSIQNGQYLLEKWGSDRLALCQIDLLEADAVDQLDMHIASSFAQLDGIVNNAGAFLRQPFMDWNVQDAQRLWQLNCQIPVAIIHRLRPWLEQSALSSVVNIVDNSSASRPWKYYASYAGSKAALMSMTQVLAKELAPRIRVNAVGPGVIQCGANEANLTPSLLSQIPMKRWGSPNEIAQTVGFLLFGPSYIIGQLIVVDGGWGL